MSRCKGCGAESSKNPCPACGRIKLDNTKVELSKRLLRK